MFSIYYNDNILLLNVSVLKQMTMLIIYLRRSGLLSFCASRARSLLQTRRLPSKKLSRFSILVFIFIVILMLVLIIILLLVPMLKLLLSLLFAHFHSHHLEMSPSNLNYSLLFQSIIIIDQLNPGDMCASNSNYNALYRHSSTKWAQTLISRRYLINICNIFATNPSSHHQINPSIAISAKVHICFLLHYNLQKSRTLNSFKIENNNILTKSCVCRC